MAERRRVSVTIDRLVLHGVAPGHRHVLARALEASLGEAFAVGAPLSAGDVPSVSVRLAAGATNAATLGSAVGRAVHSAVSGDAVGGRPR